ncbi:YafY family protein [Anaerotruncus sp.]|uniref:helix-turn-helix transcriptional regulator n=1 Tax=Anaerotruncus sp. TaxID=1872531 RepID=UPI00216DF8C0|nr:YafY family protein [Anaerotruncus sp.]MCI8493418.1 YafY family transcriptional regulator [Anaerotruncus sp.]
MKIDRLIAIIMILLERDKIKAEELANMFEVSPRTIYRDLDSINQAGIPIVAVSGPGNGVSILKSYKIEKNLFSMNEITALLMALGSIQSNLPSKEITTALAKVKGMVPPEKQEQLNFKANQIKIDFSPWLYSESVLKRIQLIQKAMEQQFLLQFEYKDNKNSDTSRTIEPYCLLLKGEDWYLQGFCLIRQDFRTFKILRMKNITINEQFFELRQFPSEQMKQARFSDNTLVPIKLRVHGDILDKIISRFGEDCLTRENENDYIAQVHMPISELAINYLLGFGTKCECIEPVAMRNKMREIASEVYRMYGGASDLKIF